MTSLFLNWKVNCRIDTFLSFCLVDKKTEEKRNILLPIEKDNRTLGFLSSCQFSFRKTLCSSEVKQLYQVYLNGNFVFHFLGHRMKKCSDLYVFSYTFLRTNQGFDQKIIFFCWFLDVRENQFLLVGNGYSLSVLMMLFFQVMPYSTGCKTPLSNFEANSNYKV